MKNLEGHHRFGQFLDEPVTLFDDVVQIFDLHNVDEGPPTAGEKQIDVDVGQAR
ncbi:hypothetical protein JM93_01331 [Roseibium hamelinense]|uniref:Uncharacterized protein n=1 Tax=Roseibium hamelinense TaxID=150831 RepID=A0A562TBT4_9HYPH|nr:hypothetical protein JM93_01331 [Roseibium hamelinense]